MANVLFYAKEATVKTAAAITTVNTTSTLISQQTSSTDYTETIKEVTVTEGSRDFTPVNVFGANQFGQHGRPEVVSCEFTKLGGNPAMGGPDFNGAAVTYTTGTYTYNRVYGGEKTASDRTAKSVSFQALQGSTTNLNVVLLNNAYCTNRKYSLSADGHLEETLTYKCLSKDYHEDYYP